MEARVTCHSIGGYGVGFVRGSVREVRRRAVHGAACAAAHTLIYVRAKGGACVWACDMQYEDI